MRGDRKVIILDNIKSDCIEQAMFILKETPVDTMDAVHEAEQIIENYERRYHHTLYRGGEKKRRGAAAFLGILAGSALFLSLLFAMLVR